jgi:hypothetical protein
MNDYQRDELRARNRENNAQFRADMNHEEREELRAQDREYQACTRADMNDDQLDQLRARNRENNAQFRADMNHEEREELRAQDREYQARTRADMNEEEKAELHLNQSCYRNPIKQYWTKQCEYCKYVHLESTSKSARRKCCLDGAALLDDYPRLMFLTPSVKEAMVHNIKHFSRASSSYNNILSLGATGIENGKGGGWEKIQGDHSCKLNGRTCE